LSKAIYGLKEVLRTWYNRIDDYFISLGFDKSLLESAPYDKSKGVEWRLSKTRMKKKLQICLPSHFQPTRLSSQDKRLKFAVQKIKKECWKLCFLTAYKCT